MHVLALIPVALFAGLAHSITVLTPSLNETIDLKQSPFVVTWSTVESDPTAAHLFIVNMAGGNTPLSKDLGPIDLTTGSYTVPPIPDLAVENDYQFNIESVQVNDNGILAQSPQFSVEAAIASSSSAMSTSTTAASSSATASTSLSTVTLVGGSTVTSVSSSMPMSMGMSMGSTTTMASSASTGASSSTSSTSSSATAKTSSGASHVIGGGFLGLTLWAAAVIV